MLSSCVPFLISDFMIELKKGSNSVGLKEGKIVSSDWRDLIYRSHFHSTTPRSPPARANPSPISFPKKPPTRSRRALARAALQPSLDFVEGHHRRESEEQEKTGNESF